MTTYIKGVNSIEMKKEINISQEVTSAVTNVCFFTIYSLPFIFHSCESEVPVPVTLV